MSLERPLSGPGNRSPQPRQRSTRDQVRLQSLRIAGLAYRRRQPLAAPPRSLLLIRPDHLGDVLFLTPALHALREAFPSTAITALVGPWSQAVLATNPDMDAVLTCPFPGFERRPKTSPLAPYRLLSEYARDLRGRFDTAVVLRFDHWWGAWLAAAAGIPQRIGHDWPESRPFLTQALPYRPDRHEVEQNAALLAGLEPPSGKEQGEALGPTRFTVTPDDRAWAEAWLREHNAGGSQPLVAIHPGAGAAVKQWPLPAWAEVAGRLEATCGVRVLLTGSAAERPLAQAVAAAPQTQPLNAAGETTLGQLAALYERCALVLGSDCGPLHLAVAVGAATVHLYGPVAAAQFGPWGDPARHIVLTTDWACAPCNRLDWPAEVLPQHACMAAITPEQVLSTAYCVLRTQPSVIRDA